MTPSQPPRRASVVVADDSEMVRHGFRMVLDAQPDMRVVATVGDGLTALSEVRRLRPDVLLADVRMPGLDGLELTARVIGDDQLSTAVVVVTTFNDDEYVARALRDGASGFLLKTSAPALLAEAVRAALDGNALISPEVTVRLLQRLQPRTELAGLVASLTRRERDIAVLVAQGMSNEAIGHHLVITPGTVKTHVANISTKLGGRNRVGIAAWAWTSGLVNRW